MLEVNSEIRIPFSELKFSYVRSSGPGGQNVNKVNSKAVLHWNIRSSPSLGLELRARLLARLSSQINQEGELVLSSDRYRDQIRNREDCLEKLQALLASAAFEPKKRKKTRPTRSSVRKRKDAKSRQSDKKKGRSFSKRSHSD
jgi:ribosome-associated protein